MRHQRWADLSDPGTGKTPPACVWQWWLWSEHGAKTCWAMPKGLLEKNRDELLAWSEFAPEDVVIVDGPPKARAEQMRSPGKVFLMGFTRLAEDWRTIKEHHPEFDAVLVDEIHMGFSTHDAKRTQALYVCMNKAATRFGAMTGTLVSGRLDSAYPVIRIIEPRYYMSHSGFMAEHAVYDDWGKVIGWQNHEKLSKILARHSVRVTFDEIFGKQEIVWVPRIVHMTAKQRQLYDKFHEEAMLELEDRWMDGSDEGVATIRARQIMAHPEEIRLPIAYNDKGKPIEWKTYNLVPEGEMTGKDMQLQIDAEDHKRTGAPLLCYAALRPEIERSAAVLEKEGLSVDVIHGDVPAPSRARIDRAFREGKLQALVASPETTSVGFNWSHVDHIAMISLDYKNVNVVQAVRRAIRGVRTKPLKVSLYVYHNSIDQRIYRILDRKSLDLHAIDPTYEPLRLREVIAA